MSAIVAFRNNRRRQLCWPTAGFIQPGCVLALHPDEVVGDTVLATALHVLLVERILVRDDGAMRHLFTDHYRRVRCRADRHAPFRLPCERDRRRVLHPPELQRTWLAVNRWAARLQQKDQQQVGLRHSPTARFVFQHINALIGRVSLCGGEGCIIYTPGIGGGAAEACGITPGGDAIASRIAIRKVSRLFGVRIARIVNI